MIKAILLGRFQYNIRVQRIAKETLAKVKCCRIVNTKDLHGCSIAYVTFLETDMVSR